MDLNTLQNIVVFFIMGITIIFFIYMAYDVYKSLHSEQRIDAIDEISRKHYTYSKESNESLHSKIDFIQEGLDGIFPSSSTKDDNLGENLINAESISPQRFSKWLKNNNINHQVLGKEQSGFLFGISIQKEGENENENFITYFVKISPTLLVFDVFLAAAPPDKNTNYFEFLNGTNLKATLFSYNQIDINGKIGFTCRCCLPIDEARYSNTTLEKIIFGFPVAAKKFTDRLKDYSGLQLEPIKPSIALKYEQEKYTTAQKEK